MVGDDPSVLQPQTPAPPATHPTDPASNRPQGEQPTKGSHSATRTNDNSDKTSTPQQKQSRIRRWYNKVHIAPAAKSTTIIVTALIGFVFGIASNQVSDFVKRTDDCYDALTQYEANVAQFSTIATTFHDKSLTADQRNAANSQYDTLIALPSAKIINKCSIPGVNAADLKHWEAFDDKLPGCLADTGCSRNDAGSAAAAAGLSAAKLASEAATISQWGLVRRAKYEVTHLY